MFYESNKNGWGTNQTLDLVVDGTLKIDFEETGCKGVDWTQMAQDGF